MSIIIKPLPLYGLIVLLSVFIGMLYIYLMLKDEIKKNKQILLFYIIYIAFAFICGKLYTMFAYGEISFFKAGLSAYGGLIGVIIGAFIFEKIINLNGKVILHSIISLPLVYALTKIACFISGCCSGILYNGIFNVIYTQGFNVKQFPIQLLETIVFLIIFVCCYKFRNKKYITYITLLLVSIFKFSLDFLRYDHINYTISPNQIFSIILFVVTFILLLKKIFNRNNSRTCNIFVK